MTWPFLGFMFLICQLGRITGPTSPGWEGCASTQSQKSQFQLQGPHQVAPESRGNGSGQGAWTLKSGPPHLLPICHVILVSRAVVFSEAEWGSQNVRTDLAWVSCVGMTSSPGHVVSHGLGVGGWGGGLAG